MGGKDINFPRDYELDLDHAVNLNVSKINMDVNSNSDIELDMGLDNVDVKSDSKVDMGLDKMNLNSNSKVDLGLDNVNICLNMGIKEMPKMKVHMPTNYDFGLEFFGLKVMNFSVCGKTMVVSEDNPTQLFYHPKKKETVLRREDAVTPANEVKLSMREG